MRQVSTEQTCILTTCRLDKQLLAAPNPVPHQAQQQQQHVHTPTHTLKVRESGSKGSLLCALVPAAGPSAPGSWGVPLGEESVMR